MNKKLITSYLTAAFLFSFVLATSASAFWPFDTLFKKSGDVKAETTEKKMMAGDVGPGGSRAFMTYQTLVSMNDTCRRMFSQEYPTPTKARITPSARGSINEKKMAADSVESRDSMYMLEFGIDPKSEKELTAIYTNLKARCENIASLTNRMQRIYKGNVKPVVTPTSVVSVTSSPKMKCDLKSREKNYGCPDGYSCSYNSGSSKWGKVSPYAMGTCVKSEVRAY